MIARVILFFILPMFAGFMLATWYTSKHPKDVLSKLPKFAKWILLILIAGLLTVSAISFLFAVEHII